MSEGWRGKRHRLPWPIDLAELYALDHLAQAGAVERVGNGFREPPAVRHTEVQVESFRVGILRCSCR